MSLSIVLTYLFLFLLFPNEVVSFKNDNVFAVLLGSLLLYCFENSYQNFCCL